MGVKVAIEKTIGYAGKFKSHVNKEEIFNRLISPNEFSKDEVLTRIEKLGWKDKKNRYYEYKYKKAFDLGKKIEFKFRDILFLGISGSLASGHPKKDDDIDFLVITKENKLWKTRFWLRGWVFSRGIPHRRYKEKERKDEACFNLWLDENNLLIPKNRQTLINAVDLVLLKPLINRNKTYEKFILINDWAKKWVATPYENKIFNFQKPIFNKNEKESRFNKFVNRLYFWPQFWYMKRKISREQIGLHEAFFHVSMVE